MIDPNEVVDRVVTDLPFRLEVVRIFRDDIQNKTEETVRAILQILEDLGYIILPKAVSADMSAINMFEDTVARWNAKEGIEMSDINGAQILQSLASAGWIILPPGV